MPFNTQGYGNMFGGISTEDTFVGALDTDYIRSTPIPYTVGGAPAGTVFSGSIADALDKILYPFVKPEVKLTSNVDTSNRQLGVDTIPTITLTASLTQKTGVLSRVEFYRGTTLLDTQSYVTGTLKYTLEVTDPVVENTTFTAKVYDVKGTSTSSSITYNFYYPNFSCVSINEIADVTMKEIIDNGTIRLEAKANKTIPYTGDMARYIFCYPTEWGALSSILDSNNFEYKNAFQTVNLIYMAGTTQVPMTAYISKEPCSLNNFKYTFKF